MVIDVYQDTVCPWCRIGKRHLELALTEWDGEPVEVRVRPFFLDPTIPPEGSDFKAHMLAKGGGRVTLEEFFARPRQMGADVGLMFNFEDISRAPNTELSHRMLALAPDEHKGALLEGIYAAYFEFGRDIGDPEVLLDVAESVGLDREELAERLRQGDGRAEVQSAVESARRLGISGVPFFVINDKYAFSGAQPPAMIKRVLEQVEADSLTQAG